MSSRELYCIGDKVKLCFNSGGTLVKDSLNMINRASMEIVIWTDDKTNKFARYQTYVYKDQKVTVGKKNFSCTGSYFLPLEYKISAEVKGLEARLNFELTFKETIRKIERLKTWMLIGGGRGEVNRCRQLGLLGFPKAFIHEGPKRREISLFGIPKWIPKYDSNTTQNTIEFVNSNGRLYIISRQANIFRGERIYAYECPPAEYVMFWVSGKRLDFKGTQRIRIKKPLATIRKGKQFSSSFTLKYQPTKVRP